MAPAEALPQPSAAPTRRCWRCLQTFACDAGDVHPGPAEWWLCEPCHDSLLPTAPDGTNQPRTR